VKLRRADCGLKEHRKMCAALRGSNLANNLQLITGASSPNPYTKKPMRPIIPYEGQASVRAFDKFINLAFPALIAKTDSLTSLQEGVVAAASPTVGEQKKGTLVLLTDKSSVSAFFRQVCFRGKTTSQCAVVGKGSADVYSALGVNNMDAAADADADAGAEGTLEAVLPALFYVPAGAGVSAAEAVRFPGKLSDADGIVAWAKDLAPSKQTPLERAGSDQQRKEGSATTVHPVHTSMEAFDAAMAAPAHADSAVVVAVMHKVTGEQTPTLLPCCSYFHTSAAMYISCTYLCAPLYLQTCL
jgi:hypothetical protein